jgi:uncharacterized protein (TIGR02246 family)
MKYLIQTLTILFVLLCPLRAFAGPAEEASAIIDRWASAITVNDVDAVLKLYTPDALLHGISSTKLYAGTQSIREYFNTVSEAGKKVTISERHMVILADTAVMGVGFYEFELVQQGMRVPRPARFTFIMMKRGNDWLITHHHSSLSPPASLQ